MLSGIGDEAELRRLGIPVVQHLPGVGQKLSGSFWYWLRLGISAAARSPATTEERQRSSGRAILVLTLRILQTCQVEAPLCSAETVAKFDPPAASWTMYGGVVRTKSRGQIRLTGPNPDDPIQIEASTLSHPDDLKAAVGVRGTLS